MRLLGYFVGISRPQGVVPLGRSSGSRTVRPASARRVMGPGLVEAPPDRGSCLRSALVAFVLSGT